MSHLQSNALRETLFERDHMTVQWPILGELWVTLGRHLQETEKREKS
jgi:hypothetical protein